jgi:3-phenylpropionate/trans-cinnamate dioxygenase ferredoxin reductase component
VSVAGVVVVGAGLAGLRGAETLRRQGYDGDVTIVGDEPHRPYSRPPLSKDLLSGAVPDESCFFDLGDLEATWLLGRSATGLDVSRRVVRLDGGDDIAYSKLLIATGCRARPWPSRIGLAGVHLLRTLDDARALRAAAGRAERAVVVGAGFLGCEVAATLRARGLAVSLVDGAAGPMAVLGAEMGVRARGWHEAAGVELHFDTGVAEFLGRDRVQGVRLAGGRVLDADLVVIAIGAQPNTEWLTGSGLANWQGAVLCDDRCLAVGRPEIGVAGDVAAWPYPGRAEPVRIEHWTNAADMAMTAAANLVADDTGTAVRHRLVPTFWSDQYGYKLRAAGVVAGGGAGTVVVDEPAEGRLVLELHRGGPLAAAITVNAMRHHLGYRRALAPRSA